MFISPRLGLSQRQMEKTQVFLCHTHQLSHQWSCKIQPFSSLKQGQRNHCYGKTLCILYLKIGVFKKKLFELKKFTIQTIRLSLEMSQLDLIQIMDTQTRDKRGFKKKQISKLWLLSTQVAYIYYLCTSNLRSNPEKVLYKCL